MLFSSFLFFSVFLRLLVIAVPLSDGLNSDGFSYAIPKLLKTTENTSHLARIIGHHPVNHTLPYIPFLLPRASSHHETPNLVEDPGHTGRSDDPQFKLGEIVHVHPEALGIKKNMRHPAVIVDYHPNHGKPYSVAQMSHGLPADMPQEPTKKYHKKFGANEKNGRKSMIHVGQPARVSREHIRLSRGRIEPVGPKKFKNLRKTINKTLGGDHKWETKHPRDGSKRR